VVVMKDYAQLIWWVPGGWVGSHLSWVDRVERRHGRKDSWEKIEIASVKTK
jgi:hypothetical protein